MGRFSDLVTVERQTGRFADLAEPASGRFADLAQGTATIPQQEIGAWQPSLWERLKFAVYKPPPAGGYDRSDRPFRTLGQAALYGVGEYATGRALYTPELVTEEPAEKISGFEPTPKEKQIGETLKFIGGLKTASQILAPVITTLPTVSGQAILGATGIFGLRNISEQVVNWLRTGEKPSLIEFEKEAVLGTLFGVGELGLIKFIGFARGLGNLRKSQIRPARAEVDAAIKHLKKTGDRAAWDTVRIKYAGITPEGAARIKARAVPPTVKEFGKYPLARPTEVPRVPVRPPVRPVEGITPTKPVIEHDLVSPAKREAIIRSNIRFMLKKAPMHADLATLAKNAGGVQEQVKPIIEDMIKKGEVVIDNYQYKFAKEVPTKPITPTKPTPAAPKAKITAPVAKELPKEIPTLATPKQKAQAHVIAKQKAFVSEKGKMRPGYRTLAKAMTGERSMKDMTSEQAAQFIDALRRLPEPVYRKGKLVPPSIPRTTKLATLEQFQRKYRKPTLLKYITSQTYYAEVLGVKEIIRPLEEAKQRFDLEFRKASVEVDKKIAGIDNFYKTSLKERATAKAKNIPTKAVAKMRDLLDKYESPPLELSTEETQIFNWFRELNKEVLRRENEVRATLDFAPIKERKAYVRHVADFMAAEMLQGKYPFPEGKAYWAQRIVGKKIFNPMELQRKIADDIEQLFTKDLAYATKSMLWNGLKEIHLSKPLRFFSEQLGAISKDLPHYKGLPARERELLNRITVMPAGTKKWLIDYVNQVIKGQETWLDQQTNALVTESGIGGLFNKALKPFGRTISRKPITSLFQKGGRLVISGVMGWRPKQLIRNKFQLFQNLALYTSKANLKSFMPAPPELRRLIDNSLFIKGYTGFEELPKDLMGKLERGWLAPYQWTAVSNATQAMKAAYWDTKELINNPKYAKYGWKPEHLLREMELGAGATQYQYIPIGMPEIFRHKALIPFTRLQSWWMNHFARFHREAVHRLLRGRPMWSDGTVTLPWSRRLGWFRYLIIGGTVLNTLGYTRSFLFGAAPTALPPAAQLALASYIYLTSFFSAASDKWKEWQRNKAKRQFYNALLTFIPGYLAYRDFEAIWAGRKDLSSLFFYKKIEKREKDKSLFRRAR